MKAATIRTVEQIVMHLDALPAHSSKAEKMELVMDVLKNETCGSDLAAELLATALERNRQAIHDLGLKGN